MSFLENSTPNYVCVSQYIVSVIRLLNMNHKFYSNFSSSKRYCVHISVFYCHLARLMSFIKRLINEERQKWRNLPIKTGIIISFHVTKSSRSEAERLFEALEFRKPRIRPPDCCEISKLININ